MTRGARLVLVSTAFAATMAAAHVPSHIYADQVFVAADPTASIAAFGEFTTGDEVFVLRFTFEQRFGAPVEMLVPHTTALVNHRPAWAIVAPGLPMPTAEELRALPRPLPAGMGAIVDLNDEPRRAVIFESVMRRFYWTSRPLAVVFAAGENEVWVWSTGHTPGKFGLGVGVEENGGYMAAFKDWAFYAY
jgi:hypothetical protein